MENVVVCPGVVHYFGKVSRKTESRVNPLRMYTTITIVPSVRAESSIPGAIPNSRQPESGHWTCTACVNDMGHENPSLCNTLDIVDNTIKPLI